MLLGSDVAAFCGWRNESAASRRHRRVRPAGKSIASEDSCCQGKRGFPGRLGSLDSSGFIEVTALRLKHRSPVAGEIANQAAIGAPNNLRQCLLNR